jgi:hypothetical protein
MRGRSRTMPQESFKVQSFADVLEGEIDLSESISITHRANYGENHYAWKGDAVQRGQAHAWVRKELLKTKPLVCEICGRTKNIELASINGHVYTRNLEDYMFMCKRCHNDFDGHFDNLKQGAEAIYKRSLIYNPRLKTKECTICHNIKPIGDFYKDGDGIRSDCKSCSSDIRKARWRKNNNTPLLKLWSEVEHGIRTCTKCGETKPLSEFVKQPSRKTGTSSHCRECIASSAKERYTPKRINGKNSKYTNRNQH